LSNALAPHQYWWMQVRGVDLQLLLGDGKITLALRGPPAFLQQDQQHVQSMLRGKSLGSVMPRMSTPSVPGPVSVAPGELCIVENNNAQPQFGFAAGGKQHREVGEEARARIMQEIAEAAADEEMEELIFGGTSDGHHDRLILAS